MPFLNAVGVHESEVADMDVAEGLERFQETDGDICLGHVTCIPYLVSSSVDCRWACDRAVFW